MINWLMPNTGARYPVDRVSRDQKQRNSDGVDGRGLPDCGPNLWNCRAFLGLVSKGPMIRDWTEVRPYIVTNSNGHAQVRPTVMALIASTWPIICLMSQVNQKKWIKTFLSLWRSHLYVSVYSVNFETILYPQINDF